jgi:hypothetical protein
MLHENRKCTWPPNILYTYTLVPPTEAQNLVGCKWIYKIKHVDGTISKYKAKPLTKRYSQQEGIDYFESFSM